MAKRFEGLSENDKRRLCDFLINKRVSLFLGSGVSLDSEGATGKMKSAGQLRKDLVSLNQLPETASLQQAYSVMVPDQVRAEITEHYTCSLVGPTVTRLARQPWRRVYTLNVDNCFEFAFRKVIEQLEFDIESLELFNFCDSYSELLSDKRCSVVHLHGAVERPDDGYVFSRDEYAQSIQRPNSWMLTLSQLIRTDTFIIAGTSLDEIDVSYYLQQRNQKTTRGDVPASILIEPYPNRLTEKLCDDHEFVLFEGTPSQFFDELEKIDYRIARPWIDNERDGLAGLGLSQGERLRFSATFEVVPDEPEKIPNPARFLLGAELTWSMLAANSDVSRETYGEIRGHIQDAIEDPEFRVLMIVDAPGSGKTALLKRLAFDFSRGSDLVFWYSGLGIELEARRTAEIFNSIPGPIIVFVDNFADALNTVSLVLSRIERENFLFVCCERDYRLPYIENAFTGEDYLLIRDALDLTREEALALRKVHEVEGLSTINSIGEERFLGQVTGKTVAEANCRIQNNFKTIDEIVDSLSGECSASEAETYLTVALARFCYAIGVRRSVLSTISFPDVVEFLFSNECALPIKYSDHRGSLVVPKHAIIGDRLIERKKKLGDRSLLIAFTDLAMSLAPRVNPSTIRRKTPEAQLLGRLMDYDNNVKRFIDHYAEDYYSALRPLCGWNARYWEQMSLLKLDRFFASPDDMLLLDESIQHARSAISAELHPFSLTTLAKVLFQAMEKSPSRRDQLFGEAWGHVVDADEREARWSTRGATLFVVCFGGVLRYVEMGGQLSGDQYEKLRDMVATTRALKMKDRKLLGLREALSNLL